MIFLLFLLSQYLRIQPFFVINLNHYMNRLLKIFSETLIDLDLSQIKIPYNVSEKDLNNFINNKNLF